MDVRIEHIGPARRVVVRPEGPQVGISYSPAAARDLAARITAAANEADRLMYQQPVSGTS